MILKFNSKKKNDTCENSPKDFLTVRLLNQITDIYSKPHLGQHVVKVHRNISKGARIRMMNPELGNSPPQNSMNISRVSRKDVNRIFVFRMYSMSIRFEI